jgi:histidine triad (HIT) family protein
VRCIFCDIIAGKSPASIVFQDDLCVVFLDTMPINPGHVLVAPKKHASMLAELSEDAGARMMHLAMRMADALRLCGVRCEGINLQLADGEIAGQTVSHTHLHVIPRFEDDGFGLRFAPSYPTVSPRDDLDTIAASLRHALGSPR